MPPEAPPPQLVAKKILFNGLGTREMASIKGYISNLEREGSTNGGEHAGPCPRCGGEDRFRVWPNHPDYDSGFFWCRKCEWSGDGIDFLRQERGHSFQEACEALGVKHKLNGSDEPNGEEVLSSRPTS